MALQLFPLFPPLTEFRLSVRDLVAQGVLIQRELVWHSAFQTLAGHRGVGLDREMLEALDRDGILSPLAFAPGPWVSWRTTDAYPVDGIVFREEEEFRPWDAYAYEQWGQRHVNALYSEWQLLYAAAARDGWTLDVPVETFVGGVDAMTTFASNHEPFVRQHMASRETLHARWQPTVKLLLRLQARYWPFVHGRSVLLLNDEHEYVDALDLEYERTDQTALQPELGLDLPSVEATYRWLADRGQNLDPLPRLHAIQRFQPREVREQERGQPRRALDFYDAAEMLRRACREITGELLPDVDQLQDPDATPRPFGRDRDQLRTALRGSRLNPNVLHVVVEGETEVCLVKRLFEAFSGRSWDGSGLSITNLEGDKLQGSRPMLEGFSIYADAVALLLDDENEARRVANKLSQDGIVREEHVTLWEHSLEEDNFTPAELIDMVAELGSRQGASLALDEEALLAAQVSRNEGAGRRKGLASVLQQMSRRPEYGAVVFSKPELAEQMAARLLGEIADADGGHDEIAGRRPVVGWVLRYLVRS